MKCQNLFSGENKKNISICCLLKILPRMLSVNDYVLSLVSKLRHHQFLLFLPCMCIIQSNFSFSLIANYLLGPIDYCAFSCLPCHQYASRYNLIRGVGKHTFCLICTTLLPIRIFFFFFFKPKSTDIFSSPEHVGQLLVVHHLSVIC